MDPPRFRIEACDAALQEVRTRLPFRYGNACLTVAPLLVTRLRVVDEAGRRREGFSSDCLPPRWFDKDPSKDYRRNVEDQLAAWRAAKEIWLERGDEPRHACGHHDALFREVVDACAARGLNALTASFGHSFLERAAIDAACRLAGRSFFAALSEDLLGLDTAPHTPPIFRDRVACRQTVGFADPLTADEIPVSERLDDGLPQALEDAIARYGLRWFKVKVRGEHEADLDRLGRLAEVLVERCPRGFGVSLDGNEQYRELGELERLIEALRSARYGHALVDAMAYVEQPLPRDVALDPRAARGVRRFSDEVLPVVIDESDELPESFGQAVDLGYRGTSHKNCKGVFKSLRNRERIHSLAEEHREARWFLTAEDLATTPCLPLQQDLASVVGLDIPHAERNGHHYFRGLDHLPPAERRAALEDHPDLYEARAGSAFLRIVHGELRVDSLHAPGYGHRGRTDLARRIPLEDWSFERLGLG